MTRPALLTVNTGSSSLKCAVYEAEGTTPGPRIAKIHVSGLNSTLEVEAEIEAIDHSDALRATIEGTTHDVAHMVTETARHVAATLTSHRLEAIGHRVVHGGRQHGGPVRAAAETLDTLKTLSPLAPAHQPHNLAGIRALAELWPAMPQSLSFDTAFHRTIPPIAQQYALPRQLTEAGILRYGFHGLSYAYIAEALAEALGERPHGRTIVAHLGSGASLCALKAGTSIATSMGLTALDGLPMATRCGDLDPGVVLHLIQDKGYSPAEAADLLYRQSGLLGVSGISADVRDLLASEAAEAREALDLFAYRIVAMIGSLAAALGGLDAVVFTAGIGENSPEVRAMVAERLAWLGAEIDPARNERGETLFSSDGSAVTLAAIPTNEELVIARETMVTCPIV